MRLASFVKHISESYAIVERQQILPESCQIISLTAQENKGVNK